MTVAPSSPSHREPRRGSKALGRMLSSGCVIGMAATLASLHSRGDAQSAFQGSASASSGISVSQGNIDIATGNPLDIITISNTSSGVIDWTPSDTSGSGSIDFLPANTIARFVNGFGTTNFTILNRINPVDSGGLPLLNQIIELNGTIESQISGSPGGNIWFYTPGGFLVGGSAVIDVGGLALSTSQIDPASTFDGVSGTLRFTGTPNSASSITISPNASITSSITNGYVAMVAPRIVQNGTVDVNGTTAYVAAEAADISINAGLFDIVVSTGSGDANGISHGGTTTGPASQSDPFVFPPVVDRQTVYMVAVPKNQAMTMLLGGSIGYQAAATASAESSAVVLSAGNDVLFGSSGPASAGAGSGTVNVTLGAGAYANKLSASATGTISAAPTGTLQFDGDADLTARAGIDFTAGQGSAINALGNLTLTAGDGINGGTINLTASGAGTGGQISVTGNLTANVTGNGDFGLSSLPPATGPSATGGDIGLTASGDGGISAASFTGNAFVFGSSGTTISGDATGGTVSLSTSGNGVLSFASTLADASADIVSGQFGIPANGGDARGGAISISATGGTLSLGDVSLSATARGGDATSGAAGDGIGGNIGIAISGGTHDWNDLFADTGAIGGDTDTGTYGAALPGSSLASPGQSDIALSVSGTGTTLNIAGFTSLIADAFAQTGGTGGGNSQGGVIRVTAAQGGTLNAVSGFSASAGAQTQIGSGSTGAASSLTRAGTIDLNAAGGTISTASIDLYATALSGFVNNIAGDAAGGAITLSATNVGGQRGQLSFGSCVSGTCAQNFIQANGQGGSGAQGGSANGGSIHIFANDADILSVGEIQVEASGVAGYSSSFSGLPSGDGTGGSILLEIQSGVTNDGTISVGDLRAAVLGTSTISTEGVVFNPGDGGSGAGGTVTIDLPVGTLTATSLQASADGIGGAAASQFSGSGFPPFVSGDGIGGTATFNLNGGSANIGALTLSANGEAGQTQSGDLSNTVGSVAGTGTGGTVQFNGLSGSLTVGTALFSANGYGGMAESAVSANGATSGAGLGGTATFDLAGGSFSATDITVSASGFGGQGGDANEFSSLPTMNLTGGQGGSGVGGNASLSLDGGTLTAGTFVLVAEGTGGQGGDTDSLGTAGAGGGGTGGTSNFRFASEGHNITALQVSSKGIGGQAGLAQQLTGFDPITGQPIYSSGPGTGGAGGSGTGGSAALVLDHDPTLPSLTIDTSGVGATGGSGAVGGNGGDGFGGTGASGAQLLVNFSTLTVTGQTDILSDGTGGQGGVGFVGRGGDGGNGFGGDAGITAINATVVDLNGTSISANGYGGIGGDGAVQTGGTVAGANGGSGTGGNAYIDVSGGAVLTLNGATILRADGIGADGRAARISGNGGNGGNGTGGTTTVKAATSGVVSQNPAAGFTQSASGIGGNGAAGVGANAQGGNGGNAASGTVIADFQSGSAFTVGVWDASSIATAGSGGAPTGTGSAGIGGTGTAGPASGIFVSLSSAAIDGVSATWLSDSGITLDALDASAMTLTGNFTATAAGTIAITHANRPATTPATVSADTISLTAGGPITATGSARLRAATNFTAQSLSGGISLTDIGAGSDIILLALSGAILVSTDLDAGGLVSADGLDIDITSLTNISFDHASASAGDFTLNAAGTARFVNFASATDIDITSSDIDVLAGAGLFATGDIMLTNGNASRATMVGGSGATGVYSLDSNEIGRLFATNISVFAPQVTGSTPSLGSASAPDLVIDTFQLATGSSSGAIASTGRLNLVTPGKARVVGAVGITGLAPTGGLTIQADSVLEIIAGSGVIDLRDGNGNLGGALSLSSQVIAAGSLAVIDAIGPAGSTARRDSLLGINDGAVSNLGHLRANAIAISVTGAGGVYIQNSGAAADTASRRGFTANSIAIATSGNAADIVINGQLTDPATGGFLTGLAALQQVQINGQVPPSGGYAPGSTVNGCLILSPTTCVPSLPAIDVPIRKDDFTRELNPETGLEGGGLPTVVIELKEFEEIGFPPLIDEPVTGTGNDDLWTREGCAGPDDSGCAS